MKSKYNLYWGEMHTHTYCYNGPYTTLDESASMASEYLDFWATSEHFDIYNAPEFDWKLIQNVSKKYNKPGKFVVFAGYERASMNGDYNLYFVDNGPKYNKNLFNGGNTKDKLDKLFQFANRNKAMVIPHHPAYKPHYRGVDWNDFDPKIIPLVEMFSMHGSSESDEGPFPMTCYWMGPRCTEGTVQEGLARGLKFGFMASSDGHAGYPGCYGMGLIAVYAEKLTRKSLWNAFWKRRTYAITGDRIKLDFKIDGHIMGEEYFSNKPRNIEVDVEGDDLLDKIEIIKNNRVFYRTNADLNKEHKIDENGRFKVRIEWGWGDTNAKVIEWLGNLIVKGGKIVSAEPCFGPPVPNKIEYLDKEKCNWFSHTQGALFFDWHTCRNGREGTNSIVFEIQGNSNTKLNLNMKSKHYVHIVDNEYKLSDLLRHSYVEHMNRNNEQCAKVKIHMAVPEKQYRKTFSIIDDGPIKNTDFYYLRVVQANGQMAWSSPIWVSRREK